MFGRIIAASLSLLVLVGIGSAHAQQAKSGQTANLELLETTDIDLRRGPVTIDLRGAKGSYRALRVQSQSGPIFLTNVQVRYSNGALHEEKRGINLLSGERTREIDNRGENRFLDSVTLVFGPPKSSTASTPVAWVLEAVA